MEDPSIEINRKRTTHDTLSLTIKHESHTLGQLLKQHLANNPNIQYAGYRQHHPLIPEIELKVQLSEDVDLIDVTNSATSHPAIPIIKETVRDIVQTINTLLDDIN